MVKQMIHKTKALSMKMNDTVMIKGVTMMEVTMMGVTMTEVTMMGVMMMEDTMMVEVLWMINEI